VSARHDVVMTPAEIEAARKSLGLSKRAAAKRAGISEGRWRQIAVGHMRVGGVEVPVNTTAATLEAMERAVRGESRAPAGTIASYTSDELVDEIRDRLRKGERDAQAKPAKKSPGAVLETAESTQLGSRSRSRSRQSLVSDQRQPVRAQSGVDEHDAPTVDEDRIRAELVDVDDAEAEQRQDT